MHIANYTTVMLSLLWLVANKVANLGDKYHKGLGAKVRNLLSVNSCLHNTTF